MVERRLSDGTRIAQLLASEIDGLGGPLEPASVVDADPDVEPTADGALAYRIVYDGEGIGEVRIRPEAAVVVAEDPWPMGDIEDGTGLSAEDDDRALVVERGAAVKRAVDALRDSLAT